MPDKSYDKKETALLARLAMFREGVVTKKFVQTAIMETLHLHDAGSIRNWFNWLLAMRKIELTGDFDTFKVVGAQPLKGDENEQVA